MNLPHSKWFRSVVWNTITNRPVSIAPPKSASQECPFLTQDDRDQNQIECQELLDGVMINCFKKAGDDKFYITTRSKLDAAGKFYSLKSFRHLFIEAYTGWEVTSRESLEWLIQEESQNIASPDENNQESAVCYSFLIQHKEHRNVKEITQNVAYLIHKAIIYQDGQVELQDRFTTIDIPFHIIRLPPVLAPSGNSMQWIKEEMDRQSWDFQGIVVKDTYGNRWRYRSEKYQVVKSLRGNSPVLMDRFVQLYQQNLTQMYLEYYPTDLITFAFYSEFIQQLTQFLYDYYVEFRIHKSCTLSEIDHMYHPHLYQLHGFYLSHLRPSQKVVTKNDVYDYLRNQPWQRISFLLRQHLNNYFSGIQQAIESV
jgi:hypothetical protein